MLLLAGFHALLHLGKLVWPDKPVLQDYHKVIFHHSIELLLNGFSFHLPRHKANQFYEGNQVMVPGNAVSDDPYAPFCNYLQSHDSCFPHNPELLLCEDGSIPTSMWFMC